MLIETAIATTKKLKNEAILNLKQCCMHCHVVLSNIIILSEIIKHHVTISESCKVCLCLVLFITVSLS